MNRLTWITTALVLGLLWSAEAANSKPGSAAGGGKLNAAEAEAVNKADLTPLTEPLVEETEMSITCALTQAPKRSEVPVLENAKECEDAKGVYHYKLWIPAGYLADDKKSWPCIFIASPNGNASMGNMASWLKARGYVVVMLVESKNGSSYSPCVGNFVSAHDDVVKRVRIQEGLKLATGLSGGARTSSVFAQLRPGFAGLIMQGAGAAQDNKAAYRVAKLKSNHVFVAMTMGEEDSNKTEVTKMKSLLGPSGFMVFRFDGGHAWAPQETFEKAITWVEQQIYRHSTTSAAVKKLLQPHCTPVKSNGV